MTADGFNVTVNPNGASDPPAVVDFALAVWNQTYQYHLCVRGDTLDPVVACINGFTVWDGFWLYYATMNPDGTITIRGNDFVADAEACV